MAKKSDNVDDTVHFEAPQAKQVWRHTITVKKRRHDMHDVSAGKINYLKCTAPGRTPHIDVNTENIMRQSSGSKQRSAKVDIFSASCSPSFLKKNMTKYWHILDIRFQDLSGTLETVVVSPQGILSFLFAHPPYNMRHEAGSSDASYEMFTGRTLVACLLLQRLH